MSGDARFLSKIETSHARLCCVYLTLREMFGISFALAGGEIGGGASLLEMKLSVRNYSTGNRS